METKPVTMKVVGRRGKSVVNVETIDSMQRAVNVLRKDRPFLPRGVYRFKSFEEAEEWKMKMQTRPRPASRSND